MTGETMSKEELALKLREFMVARDLSYKEIAAMANRSIATIKNARRGAKLSDRSFARLLSIVGSI